MSIYVIDKDENLIKISSLTVVKEGGGSPKFGELVDKSIASVTPTDLSEITAIGDGVFKDCLNLTSVVIPSNITTIGANAFKGCTNLQTLTLADGITTIGANAFDGINATEIEIPNTVGVLESEVFANNTALTSIIIPDNVTELKDNVFNGCTSLTEVTMESKTPPAVTSTSFPSNVTAIYVPYGAYDDYKSSWSNYADKIVRLPAIPSTIMVIVNNYLGELVSGANVTIAGNGLTFTGTTDEQGVFTQGDLQPATYTISVADLDGFKTPEVQEVIVTEGSSNVANVTYLEVPRINQIFGKNTLETISEVSSQISANNMTSAEVEATYGWKLNDTLDLTMTTGEKIQFGIIGFNHDDKSDGSGKAGISLSLTHCLATQYTLNDVQSNKGGYVSTIMRNQTLPTIKATLPQEFQNIIKTVIKKSANGGGSNKTTVLESNEDLFLFSQVEVGVSAKTAAFKTSEGSVYEYWNTTDDSRRVRLYDADGDGVPETYTNWKLRSCTDTAASGFRGIRTNGSDVSLSATSANGLCFGCCV